MNLYWPVYKQLEKEVIDLTRFIQFDDRQLGTYSLTMAELIIRCTVEIEAITKELYLREGGEPNPTEQILVKKTALESDSTSTSEQEIQAEVQTVPRRLYFDTDCTRLLVEKWAIDRKEIIIHSPNMYFSENRRVLIPLHKAHRRGSSGAKWEQAYQAIKHNRSQSMDKANVENLLNVLGALFILNIYYFDETYWIESPLQNRSKFDPQVSEIFTAPVYDGTNIAMSAQMGDAQNEGVDLQEAEKYVFIKKLTADACRNIHDAMSADELRFYFEVTTSEKYKTYIKEHPEDSAKSYIDIAPKLGFKSYLYFTGSTSRSGKAINDNLGQQEVVLNKVKADGKLYETLRYDDFLNTDEAKAIVMMYREKMQ